MNPPVIGGAIPSKSDYRDGIAALSAASKPVFLPASYQTDLSGFPLLSQAHVPACVSHAWAELMKLWWWQTHSEMVDFSPRFLDILSAEPDIPLDGGRRPRSVAKISARMGCATTATVPNDTSLAISQYRDPVAITAAAKAEALKYRIPGFLRIPLDPVAMREAVTLYGAVSTTEWVGSEWWTPSWADKDIDPLRTPATIVGGHQTLTKGWVGPDLNTLRNSWSAAWANNGEANYSFSKWLPYILEAWTIAEIPADLSTFLHDLPAPSDFHYQWQVNLHYGDEGDDVKWLQVFLMIYRYLQPIPADQLGSFGPKTATAVGKYQRANGINPVPSSVGPKTRAAMNSVAAL